MTRRHFGLALAALLGLAGGLAALGWAAPVAGAPVHQPCPELQVSVRASAVMLRPTLARHRNWVAFRVPVDFSGSYALCLDHRLLVRSEDKWVGSNGMARFHVRTTWVHLQRALGTLPEYRAPARWTLGLDCDNPRQCADFAALRELKGTGIRGAGRYPPMLDHRATPAPAAVLP